MSGSELEISPKFSLQCDQQHICANLIFREAFILHADCCSGIPSFFLSLFPSFLFSFFISFFLSFFLRASLHCSLVILFHWVPFSFMSSFFLCLFFCLISHLYPVVSGCASSGAEEGVPQTLEGYWSHRNTGLCLSVSLHCDSGLIV